MDVRRTVGCAVRGASLDGQMKYVKDFCPKTILSAEVGERKIKDCAMRGLLYGT